MSCPQGYQPGIRFKDTDGYERLFELAKVANITVQAPDIKQYVSESGEYAYTDLMFIFLKNGKYFNTNKITFERCPYDDGTEELS